MILSRDFASDYDLVIRAVEQGQGFAFARFHDGERRILEGQAYESAAGWKVSEKTFLRPHLEAALNFVDEAYFVGVSPPCCVYDSAIYYGKRVAAPVEQRSFATLFSLGNYRRASAFFSGLALTQQAVIVGSSEKCDIRIPENAVASEWDIKGAVEAMMDAKKTVLMAAGPAANVLAHRYLVRSRNSDRVPVVDVGAALDFYLYGEHRRWYHQPESNRHEHHCDFGGAPAHVPADNHHNVMAHLGARRTSQVVVETSEATKAHVARRDEPRQVVGTSLGGRPMVHGKAGMIGAVNTARVVSGTSFVGGTIAARKSNVITPVKEHRRSSERDMGGKTPDPSGQATKQAPPGKAVPAKHPYGE